MNRIEQRLLKLRLFAHLFYQMFNCFNEEKDVTGMFKYIILSVLFFCHDLLARGLPDPQTIWEYDCGEALVGTPVFYPSAGKPAAK